MGKLKRRAISAVLAGACLITPIAYAVPASVNFTAQAAEYDKKGSDGDYSFEAWSDNETADISFENTENNGFNFSWVSTGDTFFKKGIRFADELGGDRRIQRKKGPYAEDFGDYYISYDADVCFNKYSLLGAYGWLEDPMVEFFVVDHHGTLPPEFDSEPVLTLESEGNIYDVYESRLGWWDNPVKQYWSIRRDSEISDDTNTHVSGVINMGDHFAAWKKAGFELGTAYEINLSAEGFNSSGKVSVNSLDISGVIMNYSEGKTKTDNTLLVQPENSLCETIDESGVYRLYSFDDPGKPGFIPGFTLGTIGVFDEKVHTSGEYSYNIKSDKLYAEREMFIDFDADSFSEYMSIGMNAVQNSAENADIDIDLQVFTGDDLPVTYNIASERSERGKWITVGNTEFAVPQSDNVLKYRLLIHSMSDFFIDDLQLGEKDCKLPEIGEKAVFGYYTEYVPIADYIDTGKSGDYKYEVWLQQGNGEIIYDDGANNGFDFTWKEAEDAIFSKGRYFESKPYADKFSNYNVTYDADVTLSKVDRVGVIGWLEEPDAEYYIIDGWGSWKPPGSQTILGSFESNGITYDVYKTSYINQMSLKSSSEIRDQYWSVAHTSLAKQGVKTNITNMICLSDHFEAWAKMGMEVGRVHNALFMVESYQGSGCAKVNSLDFTGSTGQETEAERYNPEKYAAPDSEGIYKRFDFEDGIEDFEYRCYNKTYLEDNPKTCISGKNSISVKSEDPWKKSHFSITLDKYDLDPIKKYSFGTYIMQDQGKVVSAAMKLYIYRGELQQPDIYKLAEVKLESGQWTKLENTGFDFPEFDDISRYELHIINSDSCFDFSIDDLQIGKSGIVMAEPVSSVASDKTGDLNNDGVVDVFDIILCRKAIISQLDNKKVSYNADINGDGEISVSDLITLYNFVSGRTSVNADAKENEID